MTFNKKLIGFDFGMKHIGVAIGQTISNSATALTTLPAQQGVPNWDSIKQLISEWQIDALVVGLPLKTDGTTQFTTVAAQIFIDELEQRFNLPVYHVDERLSTKEARQQLFEQGGYKKLQQANIDAYAARLILEQWLSKGTVTS